MAETYCGKNCAECADRAKLHCLGCKQGPGNPYSGDCAITRCCFTKGHTTCEDCTTASTCFQWKHRADVSAERVRRNEADVAAQNEFLRKSDLLGRWLWGLFWLVIASLISGFLFGIMESQPGMKLAGELVSAGFKIGYALILLKLAQTSYCFKISGICSLIYVAFNLIGLPFADTGLATVFALAALIPSFVAQYQEYMGYSEITENVDEDLSRRWRIVWFISLGGLIAMAVGLFLALLGALLGAFLTAVAGIAVVVAEILKIVFLYKTAQLFRSIDY